MSEVNTSWYCWRLNYSTTWDVSYQSPWNHRISYCPQLCRIGPPWLATRCHNDLQRAISHGRSCRVTTMPPDAPGTCETWPFMALDVVEYPSGGNIIGSIPPWCPELWPNLQLWNMLIENKKKRSNKWILEKQGLPQASLLLDVTSYDFNLHLKLNW